MEQDSFLRSRYTFYLARSYNDCGENEKALENFLERTKMGFWDEEIYWSFYRAAGLQQALGRPLDEVLATYSKASEVCRHRAEALHAASRLCRLNNRIAEGYQLAKRGLAVPQPSSGLFIEPWVYEYALLDEFAVNAYWIEQYDKCLEACERLLREGKIPEDIRERIRKNADLARQKFAPKRPEAALYLPLGSRLRRACCNGREHPCRRETTPGSGESELSLSQQAYCAAVFD
jgi:tetratricopeptide (TPR) repeat protein